MDMQYADVLLRHLLYRSKDCRRVFRKYSQIKCFGSGYPQTVSPEGQGVDVGPGEEGVLNRTYHEGFPVDPEQPPRCSCPYGVGVLLQTGDVVAGFVRNLGGGEEADGKACFG